MADAIATRPKSPRPTTAPGVTSSIPYKLDTFPTHTRIWTRLSRVRQQLIPLKAPTNQPSAGSTPTPISTSLSQPPSRFAGLIEVPNGAVTSNVQLHEPPESREPSLKPRQTKSNLQGPPRPVVQGKPQQGAAEYGESVRDGEKTSVQSEGLSSKLATTPSEAPTVPPILINGSVEGPATRSHLVEIPFNEDSTERLAKSGNRYMDMKTAMIPSVLNDEWNNNVKPVLDEEVKVLIRGMYGGKDKIHSTSQFYMVGTRHDDRMLAEPTIVISCGTKDCKRKLDALFKKLKLHHLAAFDHPILVRYRRQPAHWAASSTEERLPEGSTDTLHTLQDVCIEQSDMPAISGLKMKFDVIHSGTAQQRYATLGGFIGIDETIFIMTTAHTFLTDVRSTNDASSPDDTSRTDPSSDTDADANPEETSFSSVLSTPHSTMEFASLWPSDIKATVAYSFLGEISAIGKRTTSVSSSSDWALFEVLNTHPLLSKFATSAKVSSVIPALQLTPGNVQILDTVNTRCTGFLTQTSASIHVGQAVMDVREVLLDDPLSSGASGAWVVRGNHVCGYVVALSGSGQSCFMVTMEHAFREIETVCSKKVKLGRELQDLAKEIQAVQALGTALDIHEDRIWQTEMPQDEVQPLEKQGTTPSADISRNIADTDQNTADISQNTRALTSRVGMILRRIPILFKKRRRPSVSTTSPQSMTVPTNTPELDHDLETGPMGGSRTNNPELESHVDDSESGIPRGGQSDSSKAENWKPWKKRRNFSFILLLTLLNTFAATIVAPSVPLIMRDLHTSNPVLGSLIVPIYVFGQIAGPLLLMPLSNTYGRSVVYHFSNFQFIIFNAACVVAPSTNFLLAFRFFAGCAAACPLAIGHSSIEEMYPDKEINQRLGVLRRRRGSVGSPKGIFLFTEGSEAIAVLTVASMQGSSIGPVIGGYLAEHTSWRLVFGAIASLGILLEFAALVLMSETSERIILQRSIGRGQNLSPYQDFRHWLARGQNSSLYQAFRHWLPVAIPFKYTVHQAIRGPNRLLRSSSTVTRLVLYLALMKGYIYLLYTTLTPIFTPSYSYATQWHLGPGKAGLAFLAIFIGNMIGSLIGYVLFQTLLPWIDQKFETRRKAIAQYRQLPLVPGSLFAWLGVVGFGWSVVKAKQLLVPLAATLVASLGTSLTVLTIEAYLADIFPRDFAVAIDASNFLGSFIGFLLPSLGQVLDNSAIGIGWTHTICGTFALAMLGETWALWKGGQRLDRNPTLRLGERDLESDDHQVSESPVMRRFEPSDSPDMWRHELSVSSAMAPFELEPDIRY